MSTCMLAIVAAPDTGVLSIFNEFFETQSTLTGVNDACHTCCQTGCGTYYQITVEIFGKCERPWLRKLKCKCTVYEIMLAAAAVPKQRKLQCQVK